MNSQNKKPEPIKAADLNRSIERARAAATSKQAPAPQTETKQPEPKQRPAHTIEHGLVTTRIWANTTALAQISWSIDQRRLRTAGKHEIEARSLQPQHLDDAIAGYREAKQWIKKTERRLRWRRLGF